MKVQLTRSLSPAAAQAAGIPHALALEGSEHEITQEARDRIGTLAVVLVEDPQNFAFASPGMETATADLRAQLAAMQAKLDAVQAERDAVQAERDELFAELDQSPTPEAAAEGKAGKKAKAAAAKAATAEVSAVSEATAADPK
jgi:hypothetical protein